MKIIEGKQAVLKPYQTEEECVLPRQGQIVMPLKPAACSVKEPQTVTCSSVILSDAKIQAPKDCILRKVSEEEMHKPVVRSTQEIPDVKMQPAIGSVAHIDDITINNLQTTEAQIVPATPELERMMEETEARMSRWKKKKWFAEKILHITNSQ